MAHDDRSPAIADRIFARICYLTQLGCVLAVLIGATPGAHAQSVFLLNCANNYFALYCRGQLPTLSSPPNATGTVFMTFLPNSTAAGTYGDTLANSSCAFSDRPLNSGEPNLLSWNIFVTVNNQTVADPTYAPFLACNASSDCVSNFCVQNNNNGGLVVQQATGQTFLEYAGSMSSGSPSSLQVRDLPAVSHTRRF